MQNVVGNNISNVHQTTAVQATPVDAASLRVLLEAFRADVAEHEAELSVVASSLHGMADTVGATLDSGDPQARRALTGVVTALPALVAGTAVQQAGEALAHAVAGWVG
ncbi:hypothetical protein [Streptomyces sp. NPDC053541]|uniref:hypothetical protein n=1 Tax=Streptomyces sp. NPDC053541 TaxID=3365709 RepID=UPI0037D93F4E